jgi:transcriptional regulator GlxA family with amidase domain
MPTVAVAVTPGAPIFELAVPCEVFGIPRPDLADPWYDFRLCAPGRKPIQVAAGFAVCPEYGLETLACADTVIVPACASIDDVPIEGLLEVLRAAYERGARIASICSGAFILAAAGLLDGRRVTTHWMHAAELARRFPRVEVDPSVLYTVDGQIFTSAGTASGLDLCIELVRRDHGSAVANALARRLVTPPHREGGQAQYVQMPVPPLGRGDSFVATLAWAREHLQHPLTMDDLAKAGHMSTRTLARRFSTTVGMSPLQWLVAQRVQRAQELLETTEETVDRIASLTGFGTAPNLRKHFVRRAGVTPKAYRQVFRRPRAAG